MKRNIIVGSLGLLIAMGTIFAVNANSNKAKALTISYINPNTSACKSISLPNEFSFTAGSFAEVLTNQSTGSAIPVFNNSNCSGTAQTLYFYP